MLRVCWDQSSLAEEEEVLGWIFEKGDWEREEGEPIIDVKCDVVWSQKCKRVKESLDCSS